MVDRLHRLSPLPGPMSHRGEKSMRLSISRLFVGALAAPLLFLAGTASAAPDSSACGNIQLLATGDCHIEVTGGCEAHCTPLSFEAACDGQCTGGVTVDCMGTC